MMWMAPAQRNELFTKLYSADIEYSPEERKQMNQMLSRFSPILNVFTAGARLTPTYSFCLAPRLRAHRRPSRLYLPLFIVSGPKAAGNRQVLSAVEYFENSIRNQEYRNNTGMQGMPVLFVMRRGCPVALPDYNDFNRPECFSIQNQILKILPMFFKVNAPAAQ